jgi:uncharacterized protein YneF (UPF0154 family)
MRTVLVISILLIILALAVSVAIDAWVAMDQVEMSVHGYIAMTLGIIVSLALGFGLMGLMFYSSRQGYDDAQSEFPRNKRKAD